MSRSSVYGREHLDDLLRETFGETLLISESLREVTMVSYEYISQTARVYSKWSAEQNPNVYNVTYFDAAGATSAAPVVFEPKQRRMMNGTLEFLIDGGVIANNPSLYALNIA